MLNSMSIWIDLGGDLVEAGRDVDADVAEGVDLDSSAAVDVIGLLGTASGWLLVASVVPVTEVSLAVALMLPQVDKAAR